MPALNEQDYARFHQMLEELADEVGGMKETPRNFLTDMIAKDKEYGERVFVSPKQLAWIQKLHEEFVGDTDFAMDDDDEPKSDPRDRDGW